MAYLLDINILLRLFKSDDGDHELVRRAVVQLKIEGASLHFAPQNAAECWNVATRPKDRNGFSQGPREAERLVSKAERLFTLLPDTPAIYLAWRRLVREVQVAGVQVHDARLVAWMEVHQVSHILTLNPGDSRRYENVAGITVVHPREVEAV